MNGRTGAVAALAFLALAAAGACSSSTKASITPPPSTTVATTDQATPSDILPPSGAAPTTESPSSPSTGPIGSTFTYTDGLSVTVTSLQRFTPSDTSAGVNPGQAAVIATVTIHNGTSANVDLALVQVTAYGGSAGNQATSVFDSANGIGSGFSGSVPVGRSATAKYAFALAPADLSNVVVQVTPDFNHDPASFTGAVH